MKSKVTVLGWYGKDNIGDSAYELAFPLLFPNVDFTFTNNLTSKTYDNVILGGGDVLNKHYLDKLKLINARKFAMSVNYAEHTDIFDKVIFRNYNTFPDFTFILKPNFAHGKELIKKQFVDTHSDHYEKVIVVIINSFLIKSSLARDYINFEKVVTDLAQIFDETTASVLFLPFGNGFPENDRIVNSIVYSRCKYWKKASLWYRPITVQDALDICCAADLTISSRLHGGIFSVIGGTPFIDLTHHSKTKTFLEFIKRSDWSVNYWKFEYEQMSRLISKLLYDKDEQCLLEEMASSFCEKLKMVQSLVKFS